MHKDIVNLAEECRSCTRYGKNLKYLTPKNASKPLPTLTQPGQDVHLDYAGPLKNHRGKNIYLLVAIDRFSKFSSVKVTKSTSGKCTVKFLRSYIDTHGIKFCTELNIEQKFCPVGDHRGCGLVERTIQTIKQRLGVMLLEEINRSIKLCLSTIKRDLRWNKQKTIQVSPFQAYFGRLSKNEIETLRDKFINNSDYLDKQHVERSALTASQLKRRIDQGSGGGNSAGKPAHCVSSKYTQTGVVREQKLSKNYRKRTLAGMRKGERQRKTTYGGFSTKQAYLTRNYEKR